METLIKKLPKSKIEITTEFSSLEFEAYYNNALASLGKELEVKGFRKGHVPENVVKENIKESEILSLAAKEAIEKSYFKTIKEKKLEVIDKAEIEILKLAKDNPFSFKATVSVLPEIKLPDYLKLASQVKTKKSSVEEKEIEEALKWIQRSRAKLKALNRGAEKEDFLEIEYSSSQIEGGIKKGDAFTLGKGSFLPGFEEQLEGMKTGEEKEFTVSVPKDYFAKEIAGKEVKFKVKVTAVFEMELPELNDKFAQSIGEFKDIASLKENIKEGVTEEKEMKEKQRKKVEIIEKIAEAINWDLPEELISGERDRLFEDFKNSFSGNPQVSFEDYLKKAGKTEEEMKGSLRNSAEKNIKTFLILRSIAEKENIEVEKPEVEKEVNEVLKKHPNAKSVEKDLDLDRLQQYTKERIVNEKVFQLLENASK